MSYTPYVLLSSVKNCHLPALRACRGPGSDGGRGRTPDDQRELERLLHGAPGLRVPSGGGDHVAAGLHPRAQPDELVDGPASLGDAQQPAVRLLHAAGRRRARLQRVFGSELSVAGCCKSSVIFMQLRQLIIYFLH